MNNPKLSNVLIITCIEDFIVPGNSTIAHMGNIAMILGRKLHWDVQKEEFVNDSEANSMRNKPERDPWKLANTRTGITFYFYKWLIPKI